MKDFQYTFLTYDPQTPSHISTRLTAYLIDDLSEIPTGDTIHYFQRPLATGFYCLILPQHPKRGIIAPVGFLSDGINELELNLKECKCLNEPTSTTEPLDAEQKRIITEAAGSSILDIKAHIQEIRPKADIDNLQWPEIFANIRAHREAKFTDRINLLEQKAVAVATKSAADAIQAAQIEQTPPPAKTEPKRSGRPEGSPNKGFEVAKRQIAVYNLVMRKGKPSGKDKNWTWTILAEELKTKFGYFSGDSARHDYDRQAAIEANKQIEAAKQAEKS